MRPPAAASGPDNYDSTKGCFAYFGISPEGMSRKENPLGSLLTAGLLAEQAQIAEAISRSTATHRRGYTESNHLVV